MTLRSFAAFSGALLLTLACASAQPAPTQSQPNAQGLVANETKSVGDWVVRCFPVKSPSPCDMFELLADKRSGRRVLGLSIAYLPGQDRHAIQIALPLGVAFNKGVVLASDTYTTPLLRYRRCDRAGCYVEGLIDNGSIDALARATSGAKVKFSAYGGRDIELPFSLNGFAEAHSTMSDLARARVNLTTREEKAASAPGH